jgi:hypothetical protein
VATLAGNASLGKLFSQGRLRSIRGGGRSYRSTQLPRRRSPSLIDAAVRHWASRGIPMPSG